MPQNPTKRLRYFDHQFLRAADFNDEQEYHLWRRRLHNRALHTWGIAEGLEVTFREGASSVTVQQGTAIDSEGREIVLTEDRTLDLSDKPPGAAVYIAVEYAEAPSDLSKETDIKDNSRWTEKPNVLSFTDRPADPSRQLIVGKVSRSGGLVAGKVDNSDRRAAGAVSGDITTSALTLRREGVDPAKWPKLTCGGAGLAVLDNASLKVVGGAIIPSVGDSPTAGIQFPSDPGRGVGDEAFIRYFATEGEDTALRIGVGNDSPDVISFWQQGAERMLISGGNVGIGSLTTAASLQIIHQNQDANGSTLILGPTSQSNLRLGYNGEYSWIQSHGLKPLAINPLGNNVGIGTTTTPKQKLEVAGNIQLGPRSKLFYQGDVGENHFGSLAFHTNHGGKIAIVIPCDAAGVYLSDSIVSLGGFGAFDSNKVSLSVSGNVDINNKLSVAGNAEFSGNVGIGTTAPGSSKLKIASSATDFADFRFDAAGGGQLEIVAWAQGWNINSKTGGKNLHLNRDAGETSNVLVGRSGKELFVRGSDGNVGIGTTDPQAKLHVINQNQDANGNTLILGPTTQSNLRLGYNAGYSWIQSHGATPLAINPLGNNVGIGTVDPKARLHVVGGAIMPALGDNPAAGIQFPPDPAKGSGDEAFIRYFSTAREASEADIFGRRITIPATESTTLRIGIGNDADDIISFWQQGAERMVISGGVVTVRGNLTVGGTKTGYVADQFVNNLGETLEKGDVIVVGNNQSSMFYGKDNNIPYLEVDLTETAYDTRVCGIVCEVFGQLEPVVKGGKETAAKPKGKAAKRGEGSEQAGTFTPVMSPQPFRPSELAQLDHTKVGPGQVGAMVTLGAFAHCKVDADIAPIEAGDLLTTSPTRGHAQKVTDHARAAGAIIGKALGGLQKGKGSIPVLVTLH